MNNNVVEIVNFSLAQGFTTQDFLSSNEAMEKFLDQQQGFLYRSLCQKNEKEFVDIVYWQDIECAKAAQQAFYDSSLCKDFAKQIEMESVALDHVNVIAYTGCDK